MANASCANCTLVSNVLTLTGAVSGTVLVGMTITMAGVPPGVTVTSYGTGTGQAGTYNCSSSAANVTTGEAGVFSLSWDMPLQGNSGSPQLADLGRAAGFGLIVASAFTGNSAGPGQEYQHGTHQAALYNAQAVSGTHVFAPSPGKQGPSITKWMQTFPQYPEPIAPQVWHATTKTSEVNFYVPPMVSAAPQNVDLTIQPVVYFPQPEQGGGFSAEYHFGTHQAQLYDSQNRSNVFPSVSTPITHQTVRQFTIPPQNVDLTIQGFVNTIPLAEGWIITMVTAGPQLADLTVQAQLASAQPFQGVLAPWNPTTIISVGQADPTQRPAITFAPPTRPATNARPVFIVAAPDRQDYTQPQGQVLYTSLPGPSNKIQPAFVTAFEQQYDKNLYPQVFTQPFIPPPPFTGFYVQAVTAGWYGGLFRTPGDIFLITRAGDFSDSTVNYQPPSSGTVGYGWMQKVSTTQVFEWLASNNAPYLPPQDPNRRFIY